MNCLAQQFPGSHRAAVLGGLQHLGGSVDFFGRQPEELG
jgi:hypothetical protein